MGLSFTEVTINSSAIRSASYDVVSQVMTVNFTDGSEYSYDGIPPSVFDDFVGSGSPGGYFNKNIRGSYSYA